MSAYLILDYGCIECGETTKVLGFAETLPEAHDIAEGHENHRYLIINLYSCEIIEGEVNWDVTS